MTGLWHNTARRPRHSYTRALCEPHREIRLVLRYANVVFVAWRSYMSKRCQFEPVKEPQRMTCGLEGAETEGDIHFRRV